MSTASGRSGVLNGQLNISVEASFVVKIILNDGKMVTETTFTSIIPKALRSVSLELITSSFILYSYTKDEQDRNEIIFINL